MVFGMIRLGRCFFMTRRFFIGGFLGGIRDLRLGKGEVIEN